MILSNDVSLWVDSLGFTLLHFCWQAAVVVLLYVAYRWSIALRGVPDPARCHAAAVVALLALLVLPVATLILHLQAASVPVLEPLATLAPIPAALPDGNAPSFAPSLAWTTWAVVAWTLGAGLFALRFAAGLWRWRHVRLHAPLLIEEEESRRIRALARRLRLRAAFEVRVSREVASPLVMGFLRYTLVLPVTFFSGLPAAQADAILTHELAHIHRRDGVINLLQSVAEILFFFHPAVWWLSKELRLQREMACDRIASDLIGSPTRYAEALLALEELRPAPQRLVLAARGGSLEQRIRYLLGADLRSPRSPLSMGAGLLLGVALLAGGLWAATGALAQDPAPQPPEPPTAPTAPSPGAMLEPVIAPAPLPAPKPGEKLKPAPVPVPMKLPRLAQNPPPPSPPDPAAAPSVAPVASLAPTPAAPAVAATPTVPQVAAVRAVPAPAASPVALARPAQAPPPPRPGGNSAPLSQAERQERLAALRRDLEEGAYKRWVLEDVAYIIRDEELAAYERLGTDAERKRFVQQFWERRDPTPGTTANEAKDEHYRRISWANERLHAGDVPGWRTERGRLYIQYGPPDEIEDHPAKGYQRWFYREIRGVGQNVSFEFGKRPTPTF